MTSEKPPGSENHYRLFIHEIRNPLTAIHTANEFMEQNLPATDVQQQNEFKKLTALITKNVNRIEQLLRKALDASADALHIHSLCDVGEIIDKALSQAEDRLVLNRVLVHKKYGQGYSIRCHEEKMLLAFGNIITNAVEAMTAGERKLQIVSQRTRSGIRVTFRDNGCGMPPEVANRLFKTPVTNKPHGLGVGLLLVKEILDAHRATVRIQSAPQEGTAIIITFRSAQRSSSVK